MLTRIYTKVRNPDTFQVLLFQCLCYYRIRRGYNLVRDNSAVGSDLLWASCGYRAYILRLEVLLTAEGTRETQRNCGDGYNLLFVQAQKRKRKYYAQCKRC